ncbi:MAG: restriction endonuclease subunit S [Bacteroidales bacterium]|nr:restriction endonuclease subunit S [Bacteroidales bacterium]
MNHEKHEIHEKKSEGLVPGLRFPEFREAGEWKIDILKNISPSIFDGTHQTPKYIESGIPFFSVENIVSGNKNKFISREDYLVATSKNKPEKGDILITRIGNIGYSVVINWDYEFSIYVTLAVVKKSVNFNSNFLNCYFQSKRYQVELHSKSLLNAVPCKINMDELRKTEVLLPTEKEQQKIADCLSSLDELITAEAQKIDTLKAHKKGLMQQLFPAEGETVPGLRFPEFRDAGEWEVKQLIDVSDKKTKWSFIGGPFGSNLKSSDYVADGIRIIQLQNIGDAEFFDDYKIFTSEEKADELLANNIYPGEIILSKMGDPVGRACLIPYKHARYVMCSDGIRLVVDEKAYSKYFIYTLINSIQFRALVEKTATGSTRKRIGLDDLKNLPMVVPKPEEQQKIADCLSSLDELITAEAQKLDTLKAHKKGLMQGLFPSADEVGV